MALQYELVRAVLVAEIVLAVFLELPIPSRPYLCP